MGTVHKSAGQESVDDVVAAYDRNDFEAALGPFRRLAEQGDPLAQFYLGRMFSRGEAVVQDHVEAASWYLKSAEQGYFKAQHNLAMMFEAGQGVPRDPAAAASWWRSAAEQGCSMSQFSLGLKYLYGVGVMQNHAEAAAWFRKAAEQGYGDAEYNLGRMYLEGNGVPEDIAAAERLIRSAANRGVIKAQCSLATMYVIGQGVPQDDSEAFNWYHKGAKHRDPDALRGLGLMYDAGRGVPSDAAEALSCFRQAADLGDEKSQAILGQKYQFGIGVTQDYATATLFYQKAAERGHAEAQYALGGMYADALGVSLNYVEAAKWFRKAAEQGLAKAQFNLGLAHLHAQGVPQDLQAAFYWIKQAADRGDSKAQNSIGIMYANGQGTRQDHRAAAFWFHKAADQGNVISQHWLSSMYFQGNGVPQDYVQAYLWLCLAETGSKDAEDPSFHKSTVDSLELVGGRMTAEQIAEAQRLVQQWKPKTGEQSVNAAAFAAARAWQRLDAVLSAYGSLPADQWQGRHSHEGVDIVFPDVERAGSLLSEAKRMMEAGSPPATILSLLDDSLRLDYVGALDGAAVEMRAEYYAGVGLDEPQRAAELYSIGVLLTQRKHWGDAATVYQAAGNLDPLLAWHFNNLAWMVSTSPDPRANAGQYAVIEAVKACEVSGWGCWTFLGTLAAALARAGDFTRAAEWQRISLRLAPEKEKVEALEMLNRFQSGEAYVDVGRKPAAGEAGPSDAELQKIDVEALLSRSSELIGTTQTAVQ